MSNTNAPLWDRLPPRPLTVSEWAAALPETVPNGGMNVWLAPGVGEEAHEAVIAGRRYHFLVLAERDGSLLVNGKPATEDDPEYELITKRWRRVGATDFERVETPHPEAIKEFHVEHDAAEFPPDGSGVHIATYDGDERKYATSSVEYESMTEEEARDIRETLAEQAAEAAVGDEWAVGGDYTGSGNGSQPGDPNGSSGEDEPIIADEPLDTSHGAVERTAGWVGVVPEKFDTAGDLPRRASFEGSVISYNGVLTYDAEYDLVVEYNEMTGEWSVASSAIFESGVVENSKSGETYPQEVTAFVQDYALRQESHLVSAGENGVHAEVTVRVPREPSRVSAASHKNVEASPVTAGKTMRVVGEEEPRVTESEFTLDGPLSDVGLVLAASFNDVQAMENGAIGEAVADGRQAIEAAGSIGEVVEALEPLGEAVAETMKTTIEQINEATEQVVTACETAKEPGEPDPDDPSATADEVAEKAERLKEQVKAAGTVGDTGAIADPLDTPPTVAGRDRRAKDAVTVESVTGDAAEELEREAMKEIARRAEQSKRYRRPGRRD
jgi:hypothetical protein